MASNELALVRCEWCGERFEPPENNPDQRFCSRSCAAKQMHAARGNELGDVQRIVLERDNHTCQRCGCDVERGHRKSDRSAELHHLIPKAAGGPDVPENLVTLCFNCHKQAHQKMKRIAEHRPDVLEELRTVVCGGTDA